MSAALVHTDGDRLKLKECLQGDLEALAFLREKHQPFLRAVLIRRGASATEAEDLLADFWGDCVPGLDDRPALLERFSGRCSLGSWLATVATNRLFDLKRKRRFRGPSFHGQDQVPPAVASGGALGQAPLAKDPDLVDLLRVSLQRAFDVCSADALLMLRLVYLHGLTQREVGRMWGWHESKVSRRLDQCLSEIQSDTLRFINKADPWMELTWGDFLDLCQTHQLGFI